MHRCSFHSHCGERARTNRRRSDLSDPSPGHSRSWSDSVLARRDAGLLGDDLTAARPRLGERHCGLFMPATSRSSSLEDDRMRPRRSAAGQAGGERIALSSVDGGRRAAEPTATCGRVERPRPSIANRPAGRQATSVQSADRGQRPVRATNTRPDRAGPGSVAASRGPPRAGAAALRCCIRDEVGQRARRPDPSPIDAEAAHQLARRRKTAVAPGRLAPPSADRPASPGRSDTPDRRSGSSRPPRRGS